MQVVNAETPMDLTHIHFDGTRRPRPKGVEPVSREAPPSAGRGVVAAGPAPGGLPAFVLREAGLDPEVYRAGPLERRIAACLRALRAESEPSARLRLNASPVLVDRAVSTLLIGVSGFFRDSPVFEAIERTVIPSLARRPGRLRIWSIGCSSGAELYSVAVLLAEAGELERADLFGTDCRADAVALARAGVFTDEEVAGIENDALRSRYLERIRGGWRVVEPLRRATDWKVSDVTRERAEGPWDLVLCRNLFIYLQSATTDAILRGIRARLRPGGFLVVGKAERPPASLNFTAVVRCVYRNDVV